MKRVAKFEKVSWEQFLEDWRDTFGNEQEQAKSQKIYDRIRIPRRATAVGAW